jgi:hypothetical protein
LALLPVVSRGLITEWFVQVLKGLAEHRLIARGGGPLALAAAAYAGFQGVEAVTEGDLLHAVWWPIGAAGFVGLAVVARAFDRLVRESSEALVRRNLMLTVVYLLLPFYRVFHILGDIKSVTEQLTGRAYWWEKTAHFGAQIGGMVGGGTIRRSVEEDAEDARESQTRYEVVERFARHSLVRCQPLTGRLHQIRVHMAGIGHPVLADEFYSSSPTFRRSDIPGGSNGDAEAESDEPPLLDRQALHAHSLKFQHPITKHPISVEAPLATDMQAALEVLLESRLQAAP